MSDAPEQIYITRNVNRGFIVEMESKYHSPLIDIIRAEYRRADIPWLPEELVEQINKYATEATENPNVPLHIGMLLHRIRLTLAAGEGKE